MFCANFMNSVFAKLLRAASVAAASCACAAFSQSLDGFSGGVEVDRPAMFFGPESAMSAYEGSWRGTQRISIEGDRELGAFEIRQTFSRAPDGSLECEAVMTAGIHSASLKSKMFLEGGSLVLSAVDGAGKPVKYRGFIKDSAVVWIPYCLFMSFSAQSDDFSFDGNNLVITTVGHQYVEIPSNSFKGYLRTDASMVKVGGGAVRETPATPAAPKIPDAGSGLGFPPLTVPEIKIDTFGD